MVSLSQQRFPISLERSNWARSSHSHWLRSVCNVYLRRIPWLGVSPVDADVMREVSGSINGWLNTGSLLSDTNISWRWWKTGRVQEMRGTLVGNVPNLLYFLRTSKRFMTENFFMKKHLQNEPRLPVRFVPWHCKLQKSWNQIKHFPGSCQSRK